MRVISALACLALCLAAAHTAAATQGDMDVSNLRKASDGTVQNGPTYWYNSISGETTFTDPLEAKKGYHDGEHGRTYWVDPKTGGSVWEVLEEYAWTAVKPENAPHGAPDNPEGREYYANSKTNETTWDMPKILAWNVAEVGFWYNHVTGESRAEPPEELGFFDPKHNKHYWKDPKTGEPTWEIPNSDWAWEAANATEGEFKGREFYHNAQTNETVWEKPAILGWTRKSPTKTFYYNQVTGKSQYERPKELGVLSDEHNQAYYVDEKTGESTWEKPTYAAWEEHRSEEAGHEGRTYYHNTVSSETTWDRPAEIGWITMHEDL